MSLSNVYSLAPPILQLCSPPTCIMYYPLAQACKMAIRESIEAEIRKEKEFRENPDIVRKLCKRNFDITDQV